MERDFTLALLRLFLFLPLVLVLAYVTVRYGLGRANSLMAAAGHLKVVARLPVGPKAALLVVRCGRRYFLIGVGEGPPALLAELPDYGEGEAEEQEVISLPLSSIEEKGTSWWETWQQRFKKGSQG
ncbi:flagellar biosynthetic protein FliO [Moorellaceae bacterium AZ2]